jgi:leucyl-tRNA synthetase
MGDDMTNSKGNSVPQRKQRYVPHEIESKWQQKWEETKANEVDLRDNEKPPYYFLTMYPYPSGNLHVGHWWAEAPADAAARYLRMCGYNVFFPMGYDAFGLPAENAAIRAAQEGRNDIHPASLTHERINYMTRQFKQMGAIFDWTKTLATCDPAYYKWNQWLFVKMYERGIAYRKESFVNWDPVDQTVLANEQVIDGRGDRSGAMVERRLMPQWHFKITDYAEELLDFSDLDWPDRVKIMQTNWIGRSEGASVTFKSESGDDISIFTTRPDTLWGATFLVLAPEHELVQQLTVLAQQSSVSAYVIKTSRSSEIDRQAEGREKTGEFLGAYAVNPVNDKRIPIWIADYVMITYGTGAIMAVPYGDQRDFEFARKFGLEIVPVVRPAGIDEVLVEDLTEAYIGPGTIINSGPINGTVHNGEKGRASPALSSAIDYLENTGLGSAKITYRLRDWLISRQRYWGTPIPILYCDKCGIVPEKLENLPVVLPEDVEFIPTGESPLKHNKQFINAHCPECGGFATRETDTMDTFMDSSWYWLRFLSPDKEDGPVDTELVRKWTPVNTYTGGIEHAILHLMYARFFTKVMRDLGLIEQDEPFLRLRNQGIILGEDNEKMSKSRGNVVDPDDLVATYGSDTVRTYLMFIGPWEQGGPWNSQGIEGVVRFLNRTWAAVIEPGIGDRNPTQEDAKGLKRAVHRAIKEVTEDLDNFSFNTAIAELMTLLNAMSRVKGARIVQSIAWDEAVEALLLMLAPFAPHITEELWEMVGRDGSVHSQPWPTYDEDALTTNAVNMAVQINGKVRAQICVPIDATEEAVISAAKEEPNIASRLKKTSVLREIIVPGRLVNLVLKSEV